MGFCVATLPVILLYWFHRTLIATYPVFVSYPSGGHAGVALLPCYHWWLVSGAREIRKERSADRMSVREVLPKYTRSQRFGDTYARLTIAPLELQLCCLAILHRPIRPCRFAPYELWSNCELCKRFGFCERRSSLSARFLIQRWNIYLTNLVSFGETRERYQHIL